MVVPGLEVLLDERLDLVRGRKVGLLCHPASVDHEIRHAVDRLLGAGAQITRLFGPEHGIRGEAQDMIGVSAERDGRAGIPVASLYGNSFESLSPHAEDLAAIDVLVVDLQDVGSRYYTYVWTMALALQAAAKAGRPVVVLDRPNPLGGLDVEGGTVDADAESFVGLASVAVRHGMTIGEIARLVRGGLPWGGPRFSRPLECDLTVVPMRGWERSSHFEATGLPWVLPSPNMPTVDTAFVYPGLCLLEGTNLSEGRGTTRPFEIVGAPFLDGAALAKTLDGLGLPGVRFRPLTFRPMFHKHAGRTCGGVHLHVFDQSRFRPYRTGVALLGAARSLAPKDFAWRTEPYEFVSLRPAIDLLTGSDLVRRGVDAGATLEDLASAWRPAERAFTEARAPHLLY